MGSHGGLAIVEGLLLIVVPIRAVLEVVFGERGPGSVVTSLVATRGGTGEEERVCNVPTEGVRAEVFPSLAVRERDGVSIWVEDDGVDSIGIRAQINLYKM